MFTLPDLPYAYDALEPHIDKETMEIHHDKHHKAYMDKLNTALEGYEELGDKSIEELLGNLDAVPEDVTRNKSYPIRHVNAHGALGHSAAKSAVA